MSSEMRESKFTNEDLETISRTWNSNKYTEHTAMLLASELLRARALLARTEAGAKPFGWWIECHGTDGDFGQFVTDRAFVDLLRSHDVVERETALYTNPQDASGDAAMREALENSNSLLVALLIEPRDRTEIEQQIADNRAAMQAKEAK